MQQDKENLEENSSDNVNNDISKLEETLLDKAGAAGDEAAMTHLDNTDADGVPLNEKSSATDVSGNDLDVPGSELDDANEAIGEEDEENNSYSIADTDS